MGYVKRFSKTAGKIAAAAYGRYKTSKRSGKKTTTRRNKKRRGGSKKKYKSSNRKTAIHGEEIHGGASASSIVIRGRKVRGRASGTVRLMQNYATVFTNIAGQQGVYELAAVGTVHQVLDQTSRTNPPWYESTLGYEALMVSNLSNSTVYSGQNAFPKFVVNSTVFDIEMTNFSANGGYIDVYIFEPVVDCANYVFQTWINQLVQEQGGIGPEVFPVAGSTIGTPGGLTAGFPGLKPTSSRGLKSFYKCVAQREICLAAAATEKLSVVLSKNILIDQYRFLELQKGGLVFGKRSGYEIMVIQRGFAVEDKTAATHSPTFGSMSVAYLVTAKQSFSMMKENIASMRVSYGNSQIPSNIALANQNLINTADSIINLASAINS